MQSDFLFKKFGRYTVIGISSQFIKNKNVKLAKCLCECGTIKMVRIGNLTGGTTKSCGCLKKIAPVKHGYARSKIYMVWLAIKGRCYNKSNISYKNYGGRGIKLANEWYDPKVFIEWAIAHGYEPGLTIERVDVNGDYEPSNCTFIPRSEQSKNTRRNIRVEHNGELKTAAELAVIFGVNREVIFYRHRQGLSMDGKRRSS
jgi:hypothetical protein